jgi:tetratricopeptide (TPR) repeat protein
MRRSEFDTADLAYRLYQKGLVAVDQTREETRAPDPIGAIQALLGLAYQRLQEKRFDAAIQAYEEVLALDRLNQNAKKGLNAAIEARSREKAVRSVPLTKVPVLNMDLVALTKEDFDPHEGFVLSRVNGEWDVQSILKLCPMGEEAALLIFSRLLERKAITLRDPEGTKGAASTNDGR